MWRPPCTYVLICWYVSFPWIHSHELKDTSISNVRRCCWIVFQMVVIFPPSTSNVWEFSFPHSNTCCDCLLFCQSHGNKMILHFYFNLHFSIFGVSFLTPDQSLLFKLNILFFYWIVHLFFPLEMQMTRCIMQELVFFSNKYVLSLWFLKKVVFFLFVCFNFYGCHLKPSELG